MQTKWAACLVLAMSFGAAGCPNIDVDENEGEVGPTVEFDPANRIIPFPNNLLLDPATGKLNLPAQCNESETAKALREQVLNTLDGFGTFKVTINVTFTEAVDVASLTGNVVLYKAAEGGTPVNPAESNAIETAFIPNQTQRFDASCANPQAVEQVTMVPLVPLDGNSTYVVAVLDGVKTAGGAPFEPSFTWALVRNPEPVVEFDDNNNVIVNRTPLDPEEDLAQLQGIDLLWRVHNPALQFLAAKQHPASQVLLGWSFNTQTVREPMDPAVADSPAAQAATTPALDNVARLNAGADGETFLRGALPGACSADGGPLPCQAVAEVLQARLVAKQFQIQVPNPLGGTVAGPWADPVTPPVAVEEDVAVFITKPIAALCPGPCPTVVFGHGLGSSKNTLFAIAAQLASAGFNAVAIDFVAHNSRAKQVSNDAAIGCDGTPTPGTAPQCFAPFLSANLATTRDNIRQSVIDVHSLVAALKACGAANCGELSVDATKIQYMGISLGGIMGSLATATIPDIKASVLNVPGVGWVDILENSNTNAIKCPLVDALIDAGILVGDKFTPGMPSTGLCTTDEWKTQPGYRQFAVVGRWILDPADPANFTPLLAQKRILIQEVVDDQVVPNIATETEAALVGLQGSNADPAVSATPPASAAITTNPMTNKFVRYPTLPPDAATGFPGNTFSHASLLQPTAGAGVAGQLGTVRLQTDALTFLFLNR